MPNPQSRMAGRKRSQAVAQGHVGHPAGQFFGRHAELADVVRFAEFLAPLKNKSWFVYAKQPFAGPKAVLAYPPPSGRTMIISGSFPR